MTARPLLRVAIVEDQPRLRDGLALLLGDAPGLALVGAHATMEEALGALDRTRPDVALLDLGLPGMSGVEGAARIRERSPATQILVLTVHDDDRHVFAAIRAGASGYLLKDTPPQRLVAAIQEVGDGGAPMSPSVARAVVETFRQVAPREPATTLTPRERQVLALLAEGHSYKSAADRLGSSLDTVRFHVRHVYEKLHVHSKSEAVLRAIRLGHLR